MDLLQRLGVGHELGAPQERGGQGLGELSAQQLLERVEQLAHLSARQPDAPHSLREGIDRHEPRAYSLLLLRIIQLGMRDAVAAREGYGLAKDEEHTPLGIEPADGRQRTEPRQLDRPRAVGEVGHEALLAPLPQLLVVTDVAAQLDTRELAAQLADLVGARAVDVLGGEVEQEVLVGIEPQLRGQHGGSLRPYTRQVGQRSLEEGHRGAGLGVGLFLQEELGELEVQRLGELDIARLTRH